MPSDDPDKLPDVDQQIRINELKARAEEAAGGEMVAFEDEHADPNLIEGFWGRVADYEDAPWTSNAKQLAKAGVDVPPPEALDDAQVHEKLWEIIRFLASLHTYVSNTDHLSDRELYEELYDETLHEAKKELPQENPDGSPSMWAGGSYHIDMVGSGSEHDWELYLRYYADERTREMDREEGRPVPPKEKPPYDRDRLLPKAPEPQWDGQGGDLPGDLPCPEDWIDGDDDTTEE